MVPVGWLMEEIWITIRQNASPLLCSSWSFEWCVISHPSCINHHSTFVTNHNFINKLSTGEEFLAIRWPIQLCCPHQSSPQNVRTIPALVEYTNYNQLGLQHANQYIVSCVIFVYLRIGRTSGSRYILLDLVGERAISQLPIKSSVAFPASDIVWFRGQGSSKVSLCDDSRGPKL